MARYLAAIEGNRGEETRLGTPKSGIRAQAQGWNIGVKVHGSPKPLDADNDMFDIYATGGSNDSSVKFKIGTLLRTADGRIVFSPNEDLV